MPLTPVTATSVSELSAAASWNAAELQTSEPARRNAFRRTSALTARVYAAAPSANATAPPCEGWRTYGASSTPLRAARPRRRGGRASARRGTAARRATSARVGRRFDVAVPGCVGTTFQSSTSSSTPSSSSTRCTIVALASAGPVPVSWRSEVNGDAADARAAIAGRLADEDDLRVRRDASR